MGINLRKNNLNFYYNYVILYIEKKLEGVIYEQTKVPRFIT